MNTVKKVTPPDLLKMKRHKRKISMITAYDYPTARLVDEAGIDVVLVGDSVGNAVLGYDSTLPVTMEELLHHTRAVQRGLTHALLVADMPYLSFQVDDRDTVINAGRFIKEAGAEAVKLEGGRDMLPMIEKLLRARIPVMGHLGLTPQSINVFGGYRIQGKNRQAADILLEDALSLEQAGVFAMVLEGIPWQLGQTISERLTVPTIGIGAGPHCDGQVLVFHDLTGYTCQQQKSPRFVRQYCDLSTTITTAVRQYIDDVRNGAFPAIGESYGSDS